MKINEIKIIYVNQAILTITNESLLSAVKFVLNNSTIPMVEPLSLVFVSTGKQLYFDRNLFEAFAREEINQVELIQQTTVTGLYRNKSEIMGISGNHIEADSLWKLQDKKLILIDEDYHEETLLDPNCFYKIN